MTRKDFLEEPWTGSGSNRQLLLGQDNPIEITICKIDQYYDSIDYYNLQRVSLPECDRHTQIMKCIGHTVRKDADYEKRHTEKKRKILLASGGLYGRCHYKTATNAR